MQGDGGLIKNIIKEGSGWETPSKGHDVTVIYHGTLEDGTVFDSSRDRGDTFNFTLGQGQGEAQTTPSILADRLCYRERARALYTISTEPS